MQVISPDALIQQFTWRYAVKTFDATKKIPPALWTTLEQTMTLAPSSYGLQPWRFYVINDPETRAKLRPAAWNQSQITDASHLVVFARKLTITPADVDAHLARIMEVRKIGAEPLKALRDMIIGHVTSPATLPGGNMDTYTRSQTYIALGFLLSAAALLGVDACPMEGFLPDQFDQILGLREQGYAATVLAAVGYRAASDWLAPLAKVRGKHEDLVKHV